MDVTWGFLCVSNPSDAPPGRYSARRGRAFRRREQRGERSTGIRDILDEHGHAGLEIRGGAGGLSSRLADLFATARNALRGEFYDIRGGVRERLGGLGAGERLAGLRQGWWTRELPAGTEGGWAPPSWTQLKAFGHSSLAALTNYGADMVESAPGTLRLGNMQVVSYLVDQSLRRSGAVAALRDFAVDEYRAGLQDDERWATIGGGVGFMAAVLIDVAMPGPGGETRVATKLVTEGEEVMARVEARLADEVAEAGREALARVVDDVAEGGARVGEEVSNTAARNWNAGSFGSAGKSLEYHFKKHGTKVGAKDVAQYARKAEEFARTRRGAVSFSVDGATEGVTRYVKNGRYVDLAPDGSIVSFGAE